MKGTQINRGQPQSTKAGRQPQYSGLTVATDYSHVMGNDQTTFNGEAGESYGFRNLPDQVCLS